MRFVQSVLVLQPRPVVKSVWTFCWSASHAAFFDEGEADADADALAFVTAADIGGDMPAVDEDEGVEDGVVGSGAMEDASSLREGVSLGFVQASGRNATAARSLFNRAASDV